MLALLVSALLASPPGPAVKNVPGDFYLRQARGRVLAVCPSSGCPAGGPAGSLGEALTYTGASVHTCPNDDGTVPVLLSGVACMPQATGTPLPTINWLGNSNSVGGTGWGNTNSIPVTLNSTDVTDPWGGTTSTKLAFPSATTAQQSIVYYTAGTATPANYTGSVYLRTLSGTATLFIVDTFTNCSGTQVTVTPAWQRFSLQNVNNLTLGAGTVSFGIGSNGPVGGCTTESMSAATVYAVGAQFEVSQGSGAPTSLVVTPTNAAAEGNFAGYGVRIRPATTNSLQFYNALGTAPWGTGSTTCAAPTVANSSTDLLAPDGSNTATKVTFPACSAGGSNTDVVQVWTATAAPWTGSIYARTLSGSYTFNVIETLTGASGFQNTCTAVSTQWTRCSLPNSTLTAASWAFEFGFDGRGVGSSAISAGTVYLWAGQEEAGTYATDPCPTAGAIATCATEILTRGPSWPSNLVSEGSISLDVNVTNGSGVTNGRFLQSANAATGLMFNGVPTTIAMWDNSTFTNVAGTSLYGRWAHMSGWWSTPLNQKVVCLDGACSAPGTYVGTMFSPNTTDTLDIGGFNTGGQNTQTVRNECVSASRWGCQ